MSSFYLSENDFESIKYLVGRKKDWEVSYRQPLAEFRQVEYLELQKAGIESSHFTPMDWALLRRWQPMPSNSLTNEDERKALQDVAETILAHMLELGKWVLIVWLLRKKKFSNITEQNVNVDGRDNIVGNNNTVNKVTNNYSVEFDRQKLQGEVRPVLVITDPKTLLHFIPLAMNYHNTKDLGFIDKAKEKLESEDPNERAWAIEVIMEHGFRSDAEAVIQLLDDPEPVIRKLVANVIGEYRLHEAVPKLKALLETENLPVHLAEAFALTLFELDPESTFNYLVNYCASKGNTDRIEKFLTAVCVTENHYFDVLKQLTTIADRKIRLGAVQLLGELVKNTTPPKIAGFKPELLLVA